MSEQIGAIERFHGVEGWTHAQQSELGLHGWLSVEFFIDGKQSIHIPVGEVPKLIRDLRAKGSLIDADALAGLVAEALSSRIYPETVRIISPREK